MSGEQPVYLLVYASAAKRTFSQEELFEMLEGARRRNAKRGISGMLLYHDGSFIQALEGSEAAVTALYEKIARDPRHTNPLVLFRGEVPEPSFDDWSMGFHAVSRGRLPRVEGLNRFLSARFEGDVRDGDVARRLLLAFREGRWRRKVEEHHASTYEAHRRNGFAIADAASKKPPC